MRALRAVFFLPLVAVIYLSWKPAPSISEVPWIPALLGRWFDQHDFCKNVIGYGAFGLSGFIAWCKPLNPEAVAPRSCARRSVVLLSGFCALVLILELGQLALPHRTCDWADVLAGWMGIGLAWSIFEVGRFILFGRTSGSVAFQSDSSQIK